ncbi:MAG: cytidine deaminase [Spirochaetales bacterium]|nr:cytidine deaminase [Spirochaetales bacterium]MBR5098302.1 cytidine deaminase [Spirochaetales bacterium]
MGKDKELDYEILDESKVPEDVRLLLDEAKNVMKNAFAPFSKFKVGAAIRTEKGNVYRGCNVENASLGGTICAERGAAMASIASEGYGRFKAIAIASGSDDPAPPCAICRQFLAQFTDPDVPVYLISVKSGVLKKFRFGVLMPYAFTEF